MDCIKRYREKQGLTKADLATKLGVSQSFITHIETGRRAVSPAMAVRWETLTHGVLSRAALRPDIFGKMPAA